MASGCLKVTKYLLFLFNFIFFILGAVILGFGLWVVLDKASFISVLQESYVSLKIGSYILMGVGSATMVMGFLGCLGAVNEIKCLLGLYFACLLVLLLAQVAVGVFIYLQRDGLKNELTVTIHKIIVNYNPNDAENRNTEDTWDYIQKSLKCCGSTSPKNWTDNIIIANSSLTLYACSCADEAVTGGKTTGFCDAGNNTAPVYNKGCMDGVQTWLQDNIGIILGVCVGVAAVELLGMILSICLCKNIHSEDYTKVPKY